MPISPPVQIAVPFATSGLKNTIPATTNNVTGNAGYDAGFGAINMTPKTAGGIPPFGQDFNGIFFDLTTAIQFLEAGGSFPYNSTFSTAVGGYPLGAIVSRTDGSGLWRNTVANNTADPEGAGTGWQPEDAGSTSVSMTNANVTLTRLQAARSIIIITGVLTANIQLILPTYVRKWLIVNNGTGNFTVTVKTAAGTGVVVRASSTRDVYGDGTNILAYDAAVPCGATNGRMSVTATSATATFTADEVIVRSGLNGQSWLLSSFSNVINLATTGAGGMDTGTATANGFLGVYAIYNPVTQVSALLATMESAAILPRIYGGANMPSGYTASALVSVAPIHTVAGSFAQFYQVGNSVDYLGVGVLTASSAIVTAQARPSTGFPYSAKFVGGFNQVSSSATSAISQVLLPTAVGAVGGQFNTTNVVTGGSQALPFRVAISTPQVIYQTTSNSAGTPGFTISVKNYEF